MSTLALLVTLALVALLASALLALAAAVLIGLLLARDRDGPASAGRPPGGVRA